MGNRSDDLVAAFKAGNLLHAVSACLQTDRDERDSLALELAELHNKELIDAVATFEHLKSEADGPAFFTLRYVFDKALPHLNAPVAAVMRCVLRLYLDAGQDLAAGTTLNSFVDFCKRDPQRSRDALKEIEANPDRFSDLLIAVLVAGSGIDSPKYFADAIRLCGNKNMRLRKCAIYSIGRLCSLEGVLVPDSAFATLEHLANVEPDDEILAAIVKSSVELLLRDKNIQDRAIAVISHALSKGDQYTLHVASEVFGFQTKELPAALVDLLLLHLKRVRPENNRTLDQMDFGISRLLNNGEPDKAVRFLEELLLAHPNDLAFKSFDGTISAIQSNRVVFNRVLTRWFLRGDPVLCDGIRAMAAMHHGGNLKWEIDPAELQPADPVHVNFVARKAIGYLFFHPVSAASVVISLVRTTDNDELLTVLGNLLFDPLLLNFPGSARQYVAGQAAIESGKVKGALENALKSIDDYLDAIRSVGTLPALHPSEAQREAHHRHFSRLMAETYKAVEAKSPLLSLIPKSILLYGRKSITYVYNADGQQHRVETDLKSQGAEIEIPRMESLDPYGLDYKLRVFMKERLRV